MDKSLRLIVWRIACCILDYLTIIEYFTMRYATMNERIKEFTLSVAAALGIILLANGLFHAALYLVDNKPLFINMRYINWLSLALGILLLIPAAKVFKT